MKQNTMDPIEQKEIRGMNLRSIYWLLGSTVTILLFLFGIYSNIMTRLALMEQSINDKDKYTDIRIRTVEARLDIIEKNQSTMMNNQVDNKTEINTIKHKIGL